ncbi:MAG: EAL domain-containing protein [Ectothiorhodospiraceae bacterium]|nr:EAL domain-containing protein [Ectothiorhodospiraceae bacterium]
MPTWVGAALIAAALALVMSMPVRAEPSLAGKRVLLLFAYHPTFASTADLLSGVLDVLDPLGVEIDAEFLDDKRNPAPSYKDRIAARIAEAMAAGTRYDAVLASDDAALDFALGHRDLLGDLPIVFTAVNDVERALAASADPMVTGVVEAVSIGETLELMRQLDPDLSDVVAVVDTTPSGRADLDALQRAAPESIGGVSLRVVSLGALRWSELPAALGDGDSHRAVLRLTAFRDVDGTVRSYHDGLDLLLRSSPGPVYVLRELGIGAGAVGGVVVSFHEQGRQAAGMLRRVLAGEAPSAIPPATTGTNRLVVDAEALANAGLDPSRIPAHALVVNPRRPLTGNGGWVSRLELAGALGLGLAFVALVAQRRRERRIQESLRESETRFRNMVEGSIQGVLIHRHRKPLFANASYARILGYQSADEILALDSTERIYAPHEHGRMRQYQRARLRGQDAPSEYEIDAVRKDGSIVVLRNVVHTTFWGGEVATQHNVIDITESHLAQRRLRESEERCRTLIETAPEAITVLDMDSGRFIDVNDNAVRLFGLDRDHLLGATPARLSPVRQPDGQASATAAREHLEHAVAGACPVFDWVHITADGREFPAEVRLVRLPSTSRRLIRGSITDVSERRQAERALGVKSAQLEAILEHTDQGILMVDERLQIVAFNRRFTALLGLDGGSRPSPVPPLAPGDTLERVVRLGADDAEIDPEALESLVTGQLALARRGEPYRQVIELHGGTVVEMRGNPVPDGGMVATYTDITETHRLSEQLSQQARSDALTGLPNRREFEARLEDALALSQSEGVVHAMCYLDLDQFKVINDTCGHLAGDELLRNLASVLREVVRKNDTLARLGGDEFGVLLENCSLGQAQVVAAALRRCVEEFRFHWEGKVFRVGASIGLVPVTATSSSVSEVLSAADGACYTAKDGGRNRVHLFREDDAAIADRQREMRWVVKLQHALDEHRLRLDCQPIVGVGPTASDEGEHYELLLRMEDESGRQVSPGLFLPAAERYNLIGRLDRWVIETALARLADSPSMLARLHLCSINLSGHSLADDDILDFIRLQFDHTGIPPQRICFEITETAAITNLARATHFMVTLRALGCCFALDDFGSGLSSFAYLKTLPVDYLKIDGMFVREVVDDPIDRAMVKSINEMGHVMGKRTIAEFVENDAILAVLRELGVDYAQGYGVGRPRPFGEASTLRAAS